MSDHDGIFKIQPLIVYQVVCECRFLRQAFQWMSYYCLDVHLTFQKSSEFCQHNDTQHNDAQHNDAQHYGTQHNDTQHYNT
jgi:hypothetical protein